jgi:hypothetical protein
MVAANNATANTATPKPHRKYPDFIISQKSSLIFVQT